jgi:hypothetical protein
MKQKELTRSQKRSIFLCQPALIYTGRRGLPTNLKKLCAGIPQVSRTLLKYPAKEGFNSTPQEQPLLKKASQATQKSSLC